MTIPERLERLWAKWPEARPRNDDEELLHWNPNVWEWGDACWGCPDQLALVVSESALFDELARRQYFSVRCPVPGATQEPWTLWSTERTGRDGGLQATYGNTRLEALLLLAENIAGIA